MRTSFKLGKLFGIPVRINYTWFLIFALVTFSLAYEFRGLYPGSGAALYWLLGILGSLLFFGSVLAHELAHSLVARSQGTPVRDITLFLFGGVAGIEREADQPGKEALMAGVGPATSLVLALVFGVGALLLAPASALGGAFLGRLALVNGGLAVFNLLPGLPLDGGRVLRAILWKLSKNYRRATGIAAMAGRIVSFLIIGGGLVMIYLSWRAGQPDLGGLWLVFIGWFMDNAASQTYQQTILQEMLRGVRVSELMTQDCLRIPRAMSVSDLVDQYVLRQGGRCFLVTDEGRLSGLVTVHNVRALDRTAWPFTPIGEIMVPYAQLVAARPEEDGWTVLRRMDERNVNQMPVEENGQLLGLISRESLLRYVRARAELGM